MHLNSDLWQRTDALLSTRQSPQNCDVEQLGNRIRIQHFKKL